MKTVSYTHLILTIKGLIRRGEARTACTYNNIPLERCHFLDLPFYEDVYKRQL